MGGAGEIYDRIGRTYAVTRQEDPRIAAQVRAALGDARRIANVGAGTGSYEPSSAAVVAVEPSPAMLVQRPPRAAPAIRAVAERLPFPDRCFDAVLAVLTVHHWSDVGAGLAEMRRVAPRQVVLFFEPLSDTGFWGLDYWPEAAQLRTEQQAPGIAALEAELQVREVKEVLVPPDCIDGFGLAFWCRPEAYLRPEVQAGMSWLSLLEPEVRERGTAQLRSDLEDGTWEERHGALRSLPAFDGGYRLAVCVD